MNTTTSMDGLTAEEQAKRAIGYTLHRIHKDSYVGYYLGQGTETFALLTEAYATLTGQRVADVRSLVECRDPRNPRLEPVV